MPRRLNLVAPRDLVLRCGRNWTAVGFFGLLAGLHVVNATSAFSHRRYDAFMSLVFGGIFVLIAVGAFLCTSDVTVIPAERRIRLRVGYRRLRYERFVSFAQVRSVRVTVADYASGVAVICRDEEIECPSTTIPREEALLLAILMDVHLVKVIGDGRRIVTHSPRMEGSEAPNTSE